MISGQGYAKEPGRGGQSGLGHVEYTSRFSGGTAKRIAGFLLVAFLLLGFGTSQAHRRVVILAPGNLPLSRYRHEMTGEELVERMLEDTDEILRFDLTRFTSEVVLPDSASVRRPFILLHCVFERDVSCRLSTFLGYANFGQSTFWGYAEFDQCLFDSGAYFYNTTFSRGAYFGGSAFKVDADFAVSTFEGNAYFARSYFLCDADFGNANWYCALRDSVEPIPGKADFTSTFWTSVLDLRNMNTRPGVTLDFTGAKWIEIPATGHGDPRPVLYLQNADYDKLMFPVANRLWLPVFNEDISRPLLGFGSPDDAMLQTGWRVQAPDPDSTWCEWPVIQRTYGKFLTLLRESGRYDDYDSLFTEFHDLETHYKWYKGQYLPAAFNRMMKWICGYGIDPVQAFKFAILTVLLFSLLYRFAYKWIRPRYGHSRKENEEAFTPPYHLWRYTDRPVKFRPPRTNRGRIPFAWFLFDVPRWFWLQLRFFANFVLFSVNTFCTVGYDNNYPVSWLRYVCMFELVLGYITLTLFLVSLVNVLLR